MFALILKATHNTVFKDVASIVRGIYRVSEGLQVRKQSQTKNSWMDQPKQQTPSQIIRQQVSKQLKHQKFFQTQTVSQSPSINLHNNPKKLQVDTKIEQYIETEKIQRSQGQKERVYLSDFKQIPTTSSSVGPQINKVPSSRISRIFEFGKLGLSLASATIFSQGKSQEHYKDLAERVSEQLCKMRGAPLKLAQMLSIQEEGLIPTPIRKAFEKARESAHVIPVDEVHLMLTKNLGQDWRLLFKQFNQSPFASASIGQVHRATLQNGQQIAVKIQYNGVRESIESDIQNLGMLMKIPGLFPKGIFIERILKNTKQQLMQECDYELEKQFQQTYQKCMNKSLAQQSHLFKIPSIYSRYSTKQILTSTFITGIKIKDIEHQDYPQSIKNQIGRRLMKLTFKELFEMGIMQSDPNPSNFTYNPKQDVLNLYDFGATHIYKPEFLKNYYDIIRGSVLQDQDLIWEASIKTGFVTGEENTAMRNSHIESIMILGEPLRFKGQYDFGVQEITKRMYETIPLMLKNRLKSPPEEIYSLHRKLSGTYLACIRLKAKVDCFEIFNEIKFQTIASSRKLD